MGARLASRLAASVETRSLVTLCRLPVVPDNPIMGMCCNRWGSWRIICCPLPAESLTMRVVSDSVPHLLRDKRTRPPPIAWEIGVPITEYAGETSDSHEGRWFQGCAKAGLGS